MDIFYAEWYYKCKDDIVFKRKEKETFIDMNEKGRWGKKRGGGHRFLAGCTQEGGGSFRCVLCATGGVGGSKDWEKMRM